MIIESGVDGSIASGCAHAPWSILPNVASGAANVLNVCLRFTARGFHAILTLMPSPSVNIAARQIALLVLSLVGRHSDVLRANAPIPKAVPDYVPSPRAARKIMIPRPVNTGGQIAHTIPSRSAEQTGLEQKAPFTVKRSCE